MIEAFGKNVIAFINKDNMNEIKRYLKRMMHEHTTHNTFNLGNCRIDLFNVLYIEADGSYSNIITKSKSLLYCIYLSHIVKRINIKNFVRCHRSYAVNLRYIKDIVKSTVLLLNGQSIPLFKKI
ncbi:MAG: LytR/AlgR family response regulator transcription factor [Breznakia sp.]